MSNRRLTNCRFIFCVIVTSSVIVASRTCTIKSNGYVLQFLVPLIDRFSYRRLEKRYFRAVLLALLIFFFSSSNHQESDLYELRVSFFSFLFRHYHIGADCLSLRLISNQGDKTCFSLSFVLANLIQFSYFLLFSFSLPLHFCFFSLMLFLQNIFQQQVSLLLRTHKYHCSSY